MIIGIPQEIKDKEYRISATPGGVESLVHDGHTVLVQAGAGLGSGFSDEDFSTSGATIVESAEELFGDSQLVIKVKEPLPEEYRFLRPDLLLFTYLHLAASRELTDALTEAGTTSLGYETVQRDSGALPLLTPMSEIAGRMAVQIGAHYLEETQGGRGILLGGVPGVRAGMVVIIGGGVVGTNAAKVALGLGARVTIIDINLDRLRYLDDVLPGSLITMASNRRNIVEAVSRAELLIGAVLLPGAKAPILVTKADIATMTPGSVVLDVAVDQGGCIETIRPTSHTNPTYLVHDVVHYAVPNIPGAVPRTSTYALSNATLPYVRELAAKGLNRAVSENRELARGVNTFGGRITYPGVANAFGLSSTSIQEML